jgi:hypothetical protein
MESVAWLVMSLATQLATVLAAVTAKVSVLQTAGGHAAQSSPAARALGAASHALVDLVAALVLV